MTLPLVSIVTPTCDRRRFLTQCRRYVERQSYPSGFLEWVVIDSGVSTQGDGFWDQFPKLERGIALRVLHARGSLGHLHNLANRAARGQIVVHFDDDDWHHPTRVERQVTSLMRAGVALVCTDDYFTYFGPGRACRSWSWGRDVFSSGGTFAYWRSAWERHPFPALQHGEDQVFAKMLRLVAKARNLRDPTLFAYVRHTSNTCQALDELERRANLEDHATLARMMGTDLSFYEP